MNKEEASPFDYYSDRYDSWFDSPEGQSLFRLEVACLRGLIPPDRRNQVEIGVGTGRFAAALDVRAGMDPSLPMLRRIAFPIKQIVAARAETLPYADNSMDFVLMVVTICFLKDPSTALQECRRILRPGGRLLVGLVPADSPWGRRYSRLKREGHLFYRHARFYRCDELLALARENRLDFTAARSCLRHPPGIPPEAVPAWPGIRPGAGFVSLAFQAV